MPFNTVSYFAFLFVVMGLYWILPSQHRKWLILGASLVFYALWPWEFVFLISLSAFVDYYFSLKIHAEMNTSWRRLWLVLSLGTNLGLLLYFKYAYFLARLVRWPACTGRSIPAGSFCRWESASIRFYQSATLLMFTGASLCRSAIFRCI